MSMYIGLSLNDMERMRNYRIKINLKFLKKHHLSEAPVDSENEVVQSCRLLATPWTIQPMEFSRLEYWSG